MSKILQTQVAATPIGITLPIQDGNSGFFQQSFDTLTQVKNNILNLLSTRPGEKRMQPTFGSRLWTLVFDQNIETLQDKAVNIVTEDIYNWIPNVTVTNVTANLLTTDQITSNTDIYRLEIAVNFTINVTKQSDVVVVTIDNSTF